MIQDSSCADTNLSERVLQRFFASRFRRLRADVIADVPVSLDKFRKDILDPLCAREAHVKEVITQLQAFLKAFAAGDNEKSKAIGDELMREETFIRDIRFHFQSDHWFRRGKSIAVPLFWGIIQQYAMPTKVRTTIEGASRFWSKARIAVRIKAKSKYSQEAYLEYCEGYLRLCDELRKQAAAAQVAVDSGQLHSSPDATTKLTVGSFTLINTGGFTDEMMKNVAEIVEKAEHAMKSVGLGKVCYGDILVTKTIKAKATVAAFYVLANDEMFVRANVKAHWDTVQTVCHELAHRLQHKFLQGKTFEIKMIYRQIERANKKSDIPMELYPMAGDSYQDPKYGELQVLMPDFSKGKVKMISDKMPGVTLTLPIEAWLKVKHIQVPRDESKLHWVTGYAATDSGENFAEMVSYYALKKLPANQVPLLEAVL